MRFDISKEYDGMAVKQYLHGVLALSSKMIKHMKFLPDGILVNGQHATVRRVLRENDCLELQIEDTEPSDVTPVALPLSVLYEDGDIAVPSKPAHMPTHPSHGHHEDTVANALAYRYREQGVPFVFRPVNRLDRNTSGLLLIAKNRPAAARLAESIQNGRMEKSYLAVLDGEMPQREGVIDACLHRTEKSIIVREVCAPDAPDADTARTEYRVLAVGNRHTLVEASPITGRTHQLRVHFAHLGFPITGDELYGTPSPLIDRHALHSHLLAFPHPATGERMVFTSLPPADFQGLLERFFPNFDLCERN